MPLSVLIALGVIGIYLIVRGNAEVKAEETRRQEDPDGATLDALARAGSDLTREHLVEFYLYFPTQATAERVASLLQAEQFETTVSFAEANRQWSVLAARAMRPELAPLRAIRERMLALAAEHGGEYDGWGTEVEGDDAGQ